MSAITLSLILLSSIGFLLGGLYATYLLLFKKPNNVPQLLLGGLLLALSLRVGKSVFYNFTELPLVIKNMGLAANLAIGPFLLLYGKVLIDRHELKRTEIWHFFPAALYILFSPIIPNQSEDFFWLVSYGFVIVQQLVYLGISIKRIPDWRQAWVDPRKKGYVLLWSGVTLIWLSYLLIFLGWLPLYLFAALSYSVLMLVLAYFIIVEENIFSLGEKYGSNRLSPEKAQQYLKMIQASIIQDQRYLQPDLSIQEVADSLKVSTKVVSQVINEQLKLNFSTFINGYRIAEAQRRLRSEIYRPYTIASIAYDCGFNSISSFNTTFKSITKQTPSQFRKSFSKTTA